MNVNKQDTAPKDIHIAAREEILLFARRGAHIKQYEKYK